MMVYTIYNDLSRSWINIHCHYEKIVHTTAHLLTSSRRVEHDMVIEDNVYHGLSRLMIDILLSCTALFESKNQFVNNQPQR